MPRKPNRTRIRKNPSMLRKEPGSPAVPKWPVATPAEKRAEQKKRRAAARGGNG